MDLPIARELLNAELARLLSNHFADARPDTTCPECHRAREVAGELRQLHAMRKGAKRHV